LSLVIIDASVALKWFLPDEEYGQKALQVLDRYMGNEIILGAPSLLEYELVNGLIIAQKRGRVPEETILTAVEGFANLGIRLQNIARLFDKVIHLSKAHQLSAYDASYLAIADEKGAPFITADEKLFRSVRENLTWVKWLGDI
jgi:predicted nucleic acid-binding protein